jgi:phospholipid-binding lipoprotein MlaA
MNRMVFNANDAIDTAIMKPIAEGLPHRGAAIRPRQHPAFIDNLQEPRIFVNNLLQRASTTQASRSRAFYVNSTLGLAGLFDIASEHALPRQTGTFGQTLAVWGVDSGPYLVLPLVGPSNFRDAFGSAVDFYTTPPLHLVPGPTGWWITVGTYAVSGIDLRRAQHRDARSDQGPRARLIRAVPQPRPAAP